MVVLAYLVLSVPLGLLAQHQHPAADPDPDPDHNVAEGGIKVPGWQGRLDRADQKIDNLKLVAMGKGLHVTTGPAGILWDPKQTATGQYSVTASFAQLKLPKHHEGYGLLIGGADLTGAAQKYTYFIVRSDGKFLIKRRLGAKTANVSSDWTEHAAVKKPDAAGKLSNVLTINVGPDAVVFLVNGTEVARQPVSAVDTSGVVGLRVNHNLELHVEGFSVQP
jgi:hypothetical protein